MHARLIALALSHLHVSQIAYFPHALLPYTTLYNVVCAMCVHTKNDSSLEDTNLFAYPTLNDTDSNHGCLLEI